MVAAPKDAGTYSVKATLTGTDNYNTSTSSCVAYTMNKKALTSTQITAYSATWVSGATTYTRSDVATGVGNEKVTLVYTPYANSVGTYTYTTTAAANKFTLAINPANNNYSISSAGNLTLSAIAATCPTLDNYSGTYDGSNHTISVGTNAVGGTVQYRTATSGDGSTWSTTKPTYKDFTNGAKTVYVQVEGDGNHSTKDCGSKTVTINKKALTIDAWTTNWTSKYNKCND